MSNVDKLVTDLLAPFDDGFQISDLWDVFTGIMNNAEEWQGLVSGQEKKTFGLGILELVLDKVDLPGPDWLAKKVIMWIAPSLIDKFVAMAKDKFNFGG